MSYKESALLPYKTNAFGTLSCIIDNIKLKLLLPTKIIFIK